MLTKKKTLTDYYKTDVFSDHRVWTLRHVLLFLVDNLQYYIQVNVIEAKFSTLLKAVEKANEFEDVIKIHNDFVASLMSESFVLTLDEVSFTNYFFPVYIILFLASTKYQRTPTVPNACNPRHCTEQGRFLHTIHRCKNNKTTTFRSIK